MQLGTIGKGILPLTILTGSLQEANNYNLPNEIISINTRYNDERLNTMEENDYTDLVLRLNFHKWLKSWEENTMFYSFTEQIVNDENFQNIVKQGKAIVPYIIEEIKQRPSTLVWALNIIYNKTLSETNVTIAQACRLWIKYYSDGNANR